MGGEAPQGKVAGASGTVATATRGGRDPDGPPPPPWGSFPLSEVVVAIGLVIFIAGFFVSQPRGPVMIGVGLTLASLAGLEVSIREHFAGYRSHSTLLAGAAGLATTALLFAIDPGSVPPTARLISGLVAGGVAAYFLLRAFRNRAGTYVKVK